MFYVLCMYLPGSSVKIIYLNNPEERRWKRARECIPRTYKGSRSVLSSTATVAAAACSGRSITDGAAVVRSGRCFILHGEGVYHLPSTTGRGLGLGLLPLLPLFCCGWCDSSSSNAYAPTSNKRWILLQLSQPAWWIYTYPKLVDKLVLSHEWQISMTHIHIWRYASNLYLNGLKGTYDLVGIKQLANAVSTTVGHYIPWHTWIWRDYSVLEST